MWLLCSNILPKASGTFEANRFNTAISHWPEWAACAHVLLMVKDALWTDSWLWVVRSVAPIFIHDLFKACKSNLSNLYIPTQSQSILLGQNQHVSLFLSTFLPKIWRTLTLESVSPDPIPSHSCPNFCATIIQDGAHCAAPEYILTTTIRGGCSCEHCRDVEIEDDQCITILLSPGYCEKIP